MVAEDRTHLRARSTLKSRLLFAIGPTIMLAMGATVVASAQSDSPFANKKKVNAWELPQAGTAPQAPTQTQTRQNPRTNVTPPPSGGLQLRSRSLSPETAAAPPPGSPAATKSAATSNVAASNRTATAAATQSAPSENYVYSAPEGAGPIPLAGTTRPYTGPITRLSDGTSTASSSGLNPSGAYQSGPYASASPQHGAYQGGSYANVPRGSVNSPPSRAANDDTDWTVHQLPPQPGAYPRAQAGTMGQYEAQSRNPTAYDYGYRRPGEDPAPDGLYDRYAQSGDPHSGPLAGPRAGEYDPSDPNAYGAPAYNTAGPAPKRGFFNRITTLLRGGLRGGVAARENNGWEEAFVGDADIELELSTVTQSGLEWGVHGQVRAQYDEFRKGFARRLPDCPPTTAGCPVVLVAGTPSSVRGHTSQFYTSGPDLAEDTQIALESAHIFLRSAYGDVTVGRDDGAAYLFSLGAPSLLNVAASNSGVDYTGLDAVKTLNDASGFSEKVTYTSPRLLGDQVGVGVQFGVSYALDSSACGVDYCVDLNDVPNVVAPDIQDVFEAGIALDRTFSPGVSVEATATYARGAEKSGVTGLDDLQAFGTGLEFRMNDFTLGGSYLNSNQGLMNGDYEAYDVGLTWQPSVLGFTVGYGHASDDNVGLSSDQVTGGVTYDVRENIRIGAGVQYSDRDTTQTVLGTAQTVNDKATAIFIEAGITF